MFWLSEGSLEILFYSFVIFLLSMLFMFSIGTGTVLFRRENETENNSGCGET